MRPCLFRSFSSRRFSCFSFPNSVAETTTAAVAPARAFNPIQKVVCLDSNPSSVREKKIDHIRYMTDFCALIRNLSKNSRNYGALSDLDSMLAKTHYLDYATSVLVIDGLCLLRKLVRTKSVLSNLRKKGNGSDYFLYSLVIHCLIKEGRIEDVESVWNEVCGYELPSIRRIDASDFAIHLCKFGDVPQIESIFKRVLMGGGVLKQQSYIALIGALCRENEGLLAKEVLQEMKKKGVRPDNLTYLIMFQCFCRNGDLDEADSVLRKLFRRKCNMDICIYGSFIFGLCKMGKLREADKLFRKLIKGEPSRVSGVEILKEGRRAIFQLNCWGVIPEIMVYENYFRSLCSVGRLGEAEMLLKEMMGKKAVPEVCVYTTFIKALFRAGRAEDAIRFFKVERKKGLVPMEETARSIIMGLCEMGRYDDAWRIFDEIITNDGGFVPATNICNCFIRSYWKVGRLAEAMRLFEKMQDGRFRGPDVTTYMVMVNGLCNQGNVSKALCIFEEMQKNNISVNGALYEVIIKALCERGRLEEAHQYLNKMIENGHLVSYVKWKSLFESVFVRNAHGVSLGF
ncbi:hypothetical protein HHK36_008185 [Tetracentron sinense]|uniref:Pentatricopeptide repeat-containing protein-mitochondrial domain-containing protein n=1 Tax=Tetracentron sinense TaxID=13715 RepID=A0A834ZIK1_TETSI|nr:hypothetical protein HHK36_008185 [Tetracentron sinense]